MGNRKQLSERFKHLNVVYIKRCAEIKRSCHAHKVMSLSLQTELCCIVKENVHMKTSEQSSVSFALLN